MLITLKNKKTVILQKLTPHYLDALAIYLQNLSPETKARFAPHAFTREAIADFYQDNQVMGYIAQDPSQGEIIAYALIKIGYLTHDKPRLESFYLKLNALKDSTFAPSVADAWQGSGLGSALLRWIIEDLRKMDIQRIILWGGVQKSNTQAINFYQKNGFNIIGQFEYHGENYDMIREICP
jgi:diamine N-acetyltransferase